MASVARAAVLAAALACTVSAAEAQERRTLEPGVRVRVSAPSVHQGLPVVGTSRWIVGTVRETTPTTVVLQTDPADSASRTEIPFDVIAGMEMSEGYTDGGSSLRRGATRGLIMGVGVAGIYAGATYLFQTDCGDSNCVNSDELFSNSTAIVARNAAVMVGLSTLVGAAFGSTAREKWVPVDAPRAPRVRVGATPDGRTTLSLDVAI